MERTARSTRPATKVRKAKSLSDTLVMVAERRKVSHLRDQIIALKSKSMIVKRSNRWQITQSGIDFLKEGGVDTSWIFLSTQAIKTYRLSLIESEIRDLIEAVGIACEYLLADSEQHLRFMAILGKLKRGSNAR